jgi:hypothetical protein
MLGRVISRIERAARLSSLRQLYASHGVQNSEAQSQTVASGMAFC